MATKVFISWSGELSNKLAEAVRQWLPGVLQFVKPYFTPSDIEKGARWSSDIRAELDSSDIGIICLTKENLDKPWILFESGALSKNFEKSRVCTLLFDVETTDLKGPLTIFQNTRFTKSDFKKLVKTINGTGGDAKLDDAVLEEVFAMWWPKLEEQVSKVFKDHETSDEGEHRSERDILEEILELSRLSTRRNRPDMRVFSKALVDIMESLTELTYNLELGEMNRARTLCERLHRPVEYMCKRSDIPGLYEQYKIHRMGGMRTPDDDETEEKT